MKNSKFVNLVFLAAGALIWFIALHYITQWSGYFQLARHVGPEMADVIRHALPILLGVLTFTILRTNTKSKYFVSDSVDELVRVVFPDAKAVQVGTVWVITLVIITGIIFGALDWGITNVIKKLIGIRT